MAENKKHIDYAIFKKEFGSTIKQIAESQKFNLAHLAKRLNSKYSIRESGTSVSFRQGKNGYYDVELIIGFKELYDMYMTHKNLSFRECANKLITHEFLHVLYGDFDKAKLKRAHQNYCQSSGKKDPFPSSFDYKLYNIAADFVINRNLGIYNPFMRAEYFGLEDHFTAEEYYAMLKSMKDSMEKFKSEDSIEVEDDKSDDYDESDEECKSNQQISNNYTNNRKQNGKNYEDSLEEIWDSMKNNDFAQEVLDGTNDFIQDIAEGMENWQNNGEFEGGYPYITDGFGYNVMPGNAHMNHNPKVVKRKRKEFNEKWKRIVKLIEKEEGKDRTFKSYGRRDDWGRFNNRKYAVSELMYPGKEPAAGSIEQKISSAGVIFVDISGSMYDVIDELHQFLIEVVSKTGVTLAFYDSDLVSVKTSSSQLSKKEIIMPDAGGGTSFVKSFHTYCDKFDFDKTKQKVYVFTDGYDDFENIPDIMWKVSSYPNGLYIDEQRKN